MVDPWTRKKIIHDLKNGLQYREIQIRHQVTRGQVAHIVETEGLGRKKTSRSDIQKIADLAKKNKETIIIADELNLSLYQVRYALRKLGLNRKKASI